MTSARLIEFIEFIEFIDQIEPFHLTIGTVEKFLDEFFLFIDYWYYWFFKVLEADHVVQMDDLRKQLERLSTKNAEREEYVRIGHTLPARGFPLSSFFVLTDFSKIYNYLSS